MKNLVKLVSILAMVIFCVSCASTAKVSYAPETRECSWQKIKDSAAVIVEEIMFDWDESIIRDDQKPKLDSVVETMKKHPDLMLLINGYASVEGEEDYNKNLSAERSTSVKNYLVENGVEENNIFKIRGNGETNIFGDILENNRKVVIVSVTE